MMHTMIRVGNLERSLGFYVNALGMRELRRESYPEGRFTLSFIGYGDEETDTVIELTHNWDESDYQHGSGFGHIAIGVADIYAACKRLTPMGVRIIREPGPMTHTATNGARDVIAFVEDPDGYRIELIEAKVE
jgi:lactoylglutathione lyase